MVRRRARRVSEQLKTELSDILRLDMKDPRLGFVSIVDVEVSGDLRHAKVYVSVLGSDEDQVDTMTALESANGFIRTELGKRMRLRHTPELVFLLDKSMERGQRIERILRELNDEETAEHEFTDEQS